MAGPRYDIEEVYNWFAGGASGNTPKPVDETPPDDGSKLPFDRKKLAEELIRMLPAAKYQDKSNFPKALKTLWNTLKTTTPYENLDGDWFVKQMEISKENTPIVYVLLGEDIEPQERWNALTDNEKAKIIIWFLVDGGGKKGYKREWHQTRSTAFGEWGWKVIITKKGEAEYDSQGNIRYPNEVKGFTQIYENIRYDYELKKSINDIIFSRKDADSASLSVVIGGQTVILDYASLDIYKPLEEQNISYRNVGHSSTTVGVGDASAAVQQQVQNDHNQRTKLSYDQLLSSIEQTGSNQAANAFFRNIEQCMLLSSVPHLAAFRLDQRKYRVGAMYGKKAEERHIPYGGRVLPVTCDPIENFINYSSTTGDINSYTRNMDSNLVSDINYNILFSNIAEINVSSDTRNPLFKEVEMPLLFGKQRNFLITENIGTKTGNTTSAGGDAQVVDGEDINDNISGTTGSFKHVVLYKKDKNEKVNNDSKDMLSKILGINTGINEQIQYKSVEISFIGENQATARTNVDVKLTLEMPNLSFLQTEYTGTALYYDEKTPKTINYTYSPLDLITYLHRTSLRPTNGIKSINIAKYEGCARMYNPKFFKNYQRLVMKIVPQIKDNATSAWAGAFKKYIENNNLILDLALIDHTITRKSSGGAVTADELVIEYKGYIRSRLQDPVFDCLRTKEQLNALIKKEEDLITELSKLKMPGDKEKAKTKIATKLGTNKNASGMNQTIATHKTSFKTNIFTRILANKQIWRINYNPKKLLDFNVSKEFQITDAGKLTEAIKLLTPEEVTSGDQDLVTIEKKETLPLDFIYFGDLVDVLMDNFYKKNRRSEIVLNTQQFSTTTQIASRELMADGFKNFPLKIILPSFKPIVYNANDEIFKVGENLINLADFPIAISWLDRWIDENIVKSDVSFYSIGPLMNSIISDLVNGMLVEECYLNGTAEFLQFAIKSDFGLFNDGTVIPHSYQSNADWKAENKTRFDRRWAHVTGLTGVIELTKYMAPFFFKSPKIPLSEHCNFLVVYQQLSVFENYKGLKADSVTLQANGIPYFNMNSKTPGGEKNTLVDSISFSKATATYQRESRFQLESLYSLAQLASVYNVSVETTMPLLDVFPGMLIFVDAGLYQNSSIKGSIANTLGMGGFHLIEKVSHNFNITSNKIEQPKTTITANWIYAGEVEGKDVEDQGKDSQTPDEKDKNNNDNNTSSNNVHTENNQKDTPPPEEEKKSKNNKKEEKNSKK